MSHKAAIAFTLCYCTYPLPFPNIIDLLAAIQHLLEQLRPSGVWMVKISSRVGDPLPWYACWSSLERELSAAFAGNEAEACLDWQVD